MSRVSDLRIVSRLLDQPGWLDSLDNQFRLDLLEQIKTATKSAKNGRQLATMVKCLVALAKLDQDQGRLELDARKADAPPSADDRLRDWIEGVVQRRPKGPT